MKLKGLCLLVLGTLSTFAETQAADLSDIAARIEFGFYEGSPSVVAAALQELENAQADEPAHLYLLSVGSFRLADLLGDADARRDALNRCIEAGQALGRLTDDAEAHALVAACSLELADAETMRAPLHMRRAERALEAGARAAPRNPRIAYVSLVRGMDRNVVPTTEELESLVERFSEERGRVPWGYAEALVLIAGRYSEEGRVRDARDALEAALLESPGFGPAGRLLDELRGSAVR